MEIRTASTDRKAIAKAIAGFFGEQSVYLGPPTFGYRIGGFTVDREGIIHTEDEQKGEEVVQMLQENGFMEDEESEGTGAMEIKIPLEGFGPQGIINLLNLIHSKQYLINKAVRNEGFKAADALITELESAQFATAEEAVSFITGYGDYGRGFSFQDGCIIFSGFPYSTEPAKVSAYTEFAAAVVKQAKEQKRISAKETIEENEKYYMRVWLVRLGFDGKDAKETRKVLLENLKGHTAFRTDDDRVKWQEAQARRKAEREAE